MALLDDFKAFALKGNVIDLAVGVIIGGAFGKIVDSLVGDVIMPVVSAMIGGRLDFSSLLVPLGPVPQGTALTLDALKKAGVPVFAWGNFITIVVNFVLLAFVIFMMIRALSRMKKAEPAAPPAPAPGPTPTEQLLGEIRDLLKRN